VRWITVFGDLALSDFDRLNAVFNAVPSEVKCTIISEIYRTLLLSSPSCFRLRRSSDVNDLR